MQKGDGVLIPIISLNTSKDIWGEDADQFRYVLPSMQSFVRPHLFIDRPERWEKVPDSAREVPGVWGDLLTFLGGPRSCIGYKFAIIEYVSFPFVCCTIT